MLVTTVMRKYERKKSSLLYSANSDVCALVTHGNGNKNFHILVLQALVFVTIVVYENIDKNSHILVLQAATFVTTAMHGMTVETSAFATSKLRCFFTVVMHGNNSKQTSAAY